MLISKFMLFRTWIEMVYLINVLIMRSFAYKNENFEKDSYVPELKENNPCYQASDRKSTRLNSSHSAKSRMPSSA